MYVQGLTVSQISLGHLVILATLQTCCYFTCQSKFHDPSGPVLKIYIEICSNLFMFFF